MLYVSPTVTTKEIPIQDTQQKVRKESKYASTKKKKKNQRNTEDDIKGGKEGHKLQDMKEIFNKMATVSPFLPVIILNVNILNSPTKIDSDSTDKKNKKTNKKKQDSSICC